MTLTVPIVVGGIKEVKIDALDAGSWYDIKTSVQVRMPSGEIMETEPSQGILVVTTPNDDNNAHSELIDTINTFNENFNAKVAQINNAVSTSKTDIDAANSVKNSYVSVANQFNTDTNEAETGFQVVESLTRALIKQSCVKRAVKYSDYIPGSTSSFSCEFENVANEFDCLNRCKQNCRSATIEAARFVNEPSPDAGKCACLRQRSGGIMELNGFFTTINKVCWDIFGSSPDTWNDCTKQNGQLTGTDLYSTTEVKGIVDCVRLCTEEKDCDGIVYSSAEGKCWLKESAQTSSASQDGFNSILMSCLMAENS